MTEADTCRNDAVPLLQAVGWETAPVRLAERLGFTNLKDRWSGGLQPPSYEPGDCKSPLLGDSALPGQLFYSTQIPVCLWFSGKNEPAGKCRAVSELEPALAA